jgi:colicin import membrane protein
MAQASSFEHRRPQRPGGMGRGAMMALLVHAGLLIALAFGVSWRSREPAGASAELWASVPQVAAPAAVEPPPPPLPKPLPKVEVKPVEAPPPPKPDTRDADIAIEKAKAAEKERREEQEREKQERLKAEKLEREKAEKAEKLEREKAERAEAAKAAAEAERTAKLREENLKRMQGMAGATGAPQSTGTAQRDAGPSANYAGKIVARVRPNIVLTDSVPPTVRAEVEVRAAPDGTITGRRLTKSSGNPTWDEAVLRAIDRTGDLPKDDNGKVPSSIVIGFTPS